MGINLKTKEPETLSVVQTKIFDIFKIIKELLDNDKIPYYLLGGSLLGAIRHKGFIPWDDDIDIGIPRNQYDAFLKNVASKLPEHLKLRTYQDESTHHFYFARIVDTRYIMCRQGSIEIRDENIWVDIFPLDGMPNNFIVRRIHMLKLLWTRFIYHAACFNKLNLKRPNRPLSERIAIKFLQITGYKKNADYKAILDKLNNLLIKYPLEKSDWIVNFMGQYKFKEMFPKSYYNNGKMYDFEGMKILGPENYDAVLTQMYRNYMQEPTEKEKNVHKACLKNE